MASWWHPQQHSQQESGEPYEYPPGQPMVASQFFYDPRVIMVEGGNTDEYIMHTASNENVNDAVSTEYHQRRNWYNG